MSGSGSGTVINYGSVSDFLTSYGSGSTSQKVTLPMVPVPLVFTYFFAASISSQDPLSDPLLSGLKSLSLKTHDLSVPIGRCCGS
jgi:hypothetical protein